MKMVLWGVELIYHCGRKKDHFEWSVKQFESEECLSSRGCGGSWPGCQVLPAISAVSKLELAANCGSSRMSRAPNHHLMTQLLAVYNTQVFSSEKAPKIDMHIKHRILILDSRPLLSCRQIH